MGMAKYIETVLEDNPIGFWPCQEGTTWAGGAVDLGSLNNPIEWQGDEDALHFDQTKSPAPDGVSIYNDSKHDSGPNQSGAWGRIDPSEEESYVFPAPGEFSLEVWLWGHTGGWPYISKWGSYKEWAIRSVIDAELWTGRTNSGTFTYTNHLMPDNESLPDNLTDWEESDLDPFPHTYPGYLGEPPAPWPWIHLVGTYEDILMEGIEHKIVDTSVFINKIEEYKQYDDDGPNPANGYRETTTANPVRFLTDRDRAESIGWFCCFAIYNTRLSPERVAAHYDAMIAPPVPEGGPSGPRRFQREDGPRRSQSASMVLAPRRRSFP